MINGLTRSIFIHSLVVLTLSSCQAQTVPNVHNKISDATIKYDKQLMQSIINKMPIWDADGPGQFERAEIALVKMDLNICSTDIDVNDFAEDFDTLIRDFEALCALDEALRKEYVT